MIGISTAVNARLFPAVLALDARLPSAHASSRPRGAILLPDFPLSAFLPRLGTGFQARIAAFLRSVAALHTYVRMTLKRLLGADVSTRQKRSPGETQL
jgi:hypothetical protein